MTYRHFIKERDNIKKLSTDLYADLGMDSDDDEEKAAIKPMT